MNIHPPTRPSVPGFVSRVSCLGRLILPALSLIAIPAAQAADAPEAIRDRTVVIRDVIIGPALPADFTSPESRTRWDLTGVSLGDSRTIRLTEKEAGAVELGITFADGASTRRFSDLAGDGAAVRWLFPDRKMLRPGSIDRFEILEGAPGPEDRLSIDLETIGAGWVHLPSGAREVSLQRALVARAPAGGRTFTSETLTYRWVDPLAGVVAEISGPADASGRAIAVITQASVLDRVASGEALAKIYVNQIEDIPFSSVNYGWDRGAGTTVASVTPAAHPNIGALIAASSWDFSGNTSGAEVAATNTTVTAAETCNSNSCGYNIAGGVLGREDKNFGMPSLYKINSVTTKQVGGTDATIFLWAGALNEGVSGGIGVGESRFCYLSTTGPTVTRTPVPLWKFTHQDGGGFYMQPGDAWSSGVFNCEQNLFNSVCGGGGAFSILYAKNATCGGSARSGTQSGGVIKAGVVITPSGHTFNTLLAKSVAEFCVYLGSSCGFAVSSVRTVVYLWQVPWIGTVVRLQSAIDVPDQTSFTTLDQTDFKFGLFPPRTIAAPASANNTVSLSWDPGTDTHRISDYKIYWDTDSGGATPYAFNSVTNAAQVAFAGTTATISGLTTGTNYFFTVASRSNFTDPSTNVVTTYESLLYPTQVFGDVGFVYPIEVQKVTTCTPVQEVNGLMLAKLSATSFKFDWTAPPDSCLTGYRILGSNSFQTPAGFTGVTDPGLVTTFTGNPSQVYYLVIARGTTGTGPWGHYNQ